ncbi:MAG: hypothetical protein AUK51_14455 [Comamonadaceae bacterium CG2_30_59_20]|nr:MAG: hypothetical protein AUK51_14455 [Comamonadaceae bacterium CG2_30_59_20]
MGVRCVKALKKPAADVALALKLMTDRGDADYFKGQHTSMGQTRDARAALKRCAMLDNEQITAAWRGIMVVVGSPERAP